MSAGRLAAAYRAMALVAWNSLLLLAAANLAALLLLALGVLAPPPPGPLRYGFDRLSVVYPGLERAEIEELLRETWTRRYVYEPWVQHREAARSGRWVNVDEAGFRRSADQGPWPPSPEHRAVFVYGGSTTFGYGVADWQTVPSQLQESLDAAGCERPVRVYNFGRGNYYSEQERALFGRHLAAGRVPAAAVFVDGLNEWKDEPKFTGRLEYLMDEPPSGLWRRALKTLPLVDLARRLRDRVVGEPPPAPPPEDAAAYGAAVVDRWLAGRRLTAAAAVAHGVETLFVWQPVPTWGYDLEHHLFRAESAAAFTRHEPLRHGYELLDRRRGGDAELQREAGFLWLAGLQRGRAEPLYVDAAHYTAAFSRVIAERLAAALGPRIGCGAAGAQPE